MTTLKKIKDDLLCTDANWYIKSEDEDTLHLVYRKESGKASCSTAFCLGCLFWPMGLIYAFMGGKSSQANAVNVKLVGNSISINGDGKYALKIYKQLSSHPNLASQLQETETIKKALLAEKINIGLIVLVVIGTFIAMNG